MTIFLNAVQRRNPQNLKEPMKWYPVQNTVKMVEESEVAELIADETTLNPMEAQMAVRQLRKIVQRLLLDGKSVRLGNWGSFNISISSEGAATKKELTVRNIKSVNINFQAGEELRAAMQKADFAWLYKMLDEDSSKPSTPDTPDEGEGGGEAPDPLG